MAEFIPTSDRLYFTKNDPLDPRLGDHVIKSIELLNHIPDSALRAIVCGYPDEEGIILNGGRPGSAEGPDRIREFLYKLTPNQKNLIPVKDVGNFNFSGASLYQRHEMARDLAKKSHNLGYRTLSFGGGHDYGYSDVAGFLDIYKNSCPLVINFDAHLDVRPTTKGLNSGTPFYRVLEEFGGQFTFLEVGIQEQCNSLEHKKYLQDKGGLLAPLSEILSVGLENAIAQKLGTLSGGDRPCFISVDIDAFSSSEAPGCSQSWATGLNANSFYPVLKSLMTTYNVKGLGIYEVSPQLDVDNRTSKLAAIIAYHYLMNLES
jgi:formiminoglutamase